MLSEPVREREESELDREAGMVSQGQAVIRSVTNALRGR